MRPDFEDCWFGGEGGSESGGCESSLCLWLSRQEKGKCCKRPLACVFIEVAAWVSDQIGREINPIGQEADPEMEDSNP